MLKREEHQLKKLLDPLHSTMRSFVTQLERGQAQKESSDRNQERSTNDAANRLVAAILELQSVIAENHQKQANQQNKGPGPWSNFLVQSLLCLFTALAFGATAYYAYITNSQLVEIQKQTPAVIAAAKVASNSLKQTTRSFQIDQRPYLISSFPAFNPEILINGRLPANSAITANVTFTNIGKSPARKIVKNINMVKHLESPNRDAFRNFLKSLFDELRKKDAAIRQELESVPEAEQDLAPGKDFFTTNNAVLLPFSEAQLVMENSAKVMLFYVGRITYTDLFEPEGSGMHETEFCYYFFGNNVHTWHICDAYNTIK